MKHSIILDVDTGVDDALAIMFAVRHPDVEIRAITCVDGNTSLENVLANTLAVLDAADAPPIPVAGGARLPLIEPSRDASWVHGPRGLADTEPPASARPVEDVHAVELLRRELTAALEPVTIVTLAPLTNIALLIRTHPEVLPRIGRILFMGGSASTGNATAVAEFNVWHDPEAAFIVLNSGVPLTMYGLDVFNEIEVSDGDIAALRSASSDHERLAGELLAYTPQDPTSGEPLHHTVIGDAGAVCALVAPELFTFETLPVQVDLAPGLGRGQTLVDRRRAGGEDTVHDPDRVRWPLVDVALRTRAEDVADLFVATLRR